MDINRIIMAMEDKSYLMEKWEDIRNFFWYNPKSWVNRQIERINRIFFWGWVMRDNYDFDAHTIYDILYHKLDRLYYVFENHSHLMWNSDTQNKDMKRLCEARGLCMKLSKGDYMRHFSKVCDTYRFEYDRPSAYNEWRMEHNKNNKLISRSYYHKLSKRAMKLDRAEFNTDKDRLFKLLNSRIEQWWD